MSLQFTAPNMACSACDKTIASAVKAIGTAAQLTVDSETNKLAPKRKCPKPVSKLL